MARLNEPPAAPAAILPNNLGAVESVDACEFALCVEYAIRIADEMRTKSQIVRERPAANFDEVKRRFIRQNRELAKNNSHQSLRIRSLELDHSKLLAENLELRNRILRLENELYTAKTQASTAAVQRVKQELQDKIAELSGIVAGIEDVQEEVGRPERKPLEGNWKERQPLSELMRDSQMPTIAEDKLYPRRTLDTYEIQRMRLSDHSSNESPDLGPPPVAHFDYADPLKAGALFTQPSDVSIKVEEEEPSVEFPVHLETRKKRRDGQPKLDIRRHSILPQSPGSQNETSSILRTGAKRKLGDRGSDDPVKPPSQSEFTFSRKVPADHSQSNVEPVKASQDAIVKEIDLTSPIKPPRRILGDKSVNMSPRKAISTDNKLVKPDLDKPAISKDSNPRKRRTSSIPVPAPSDEVLETVEIAPPITELPPQTPAEADLFSPTPSKPSTLPQAGRGDTPPPAELSALGITTDGGIRPSRRARSAVNYAEPSLISKMRRPDKKMVDAVTGLQDHRRAMSVSGEKKPSSQSTTVIKKEAADDDDWRLRLPPVSDAIPSSPLTQKSGGEEMHASPLTEPVQLVVKQPMSSSATMSALIAASRKRRESLQHQPLGTDIDAAAKKMEEMELYDFKESSSPLTDESNKFKPRAHRRHSSVPKAALAGEDSGLEPIKAPGVARGDRLASRRRSMQL